MYSRESLRGEFGFYFTERSVDLVNAAAKAADPDNLVTAGDLLIATLGVIGKRTLKVFDINLGLAEAKIREVGKETVQEISEIGGFAISAERTILISTAIARSESYAAVEPLHIALAFTRDLRCFNLEALTDVGITKVSLEEIALNMLADMEQAISAGLGTVEQFLEAHPTSRIKKPNPVVEEIRRLGKSGVFNAYRIKPPQVSADSTSVDN